MNQRKFINVFEKHKPLLECDFGKDGFTFESRISVVDYIEAQTKKDLQVKSDIICNHLFEKYKNCQIATVYSINIKQFKRFLKEMLPIWVRKEKKNEKDD